MWESLKEWAHLVWERWWAVIGSLVAGGIGFWQQLADAHIVANAPGISKVPLPVWYSLAVLGLLYASFHAFHRARTELAMYVDGPRFNIDVNMRYLCIADSASSRATLIAAIRVTNEGADGAALDWTANFVEESGNRYVLAPMLTDVELGGKASGLISQSELIQTRTAGIVERRHTVFGWYMGISEPIPVQRLRKNAQLVVMCRDHRLNAFRVAVKLNWGAPEGPVTVETLNPIFLSLPRNMTSPPHPKGQSPKD